MFLLKCLPMWVTVVSYVFKFLNIGPMPLGQMSCLMILDG
jgi:hypothetical protein